MIAFIRALISQDFTFSKRQLGLLMLAIGGLGVAGLLSLDVVTGSGESGIGPAQRLAIALMTAVAFVGLTLIPLGNDPA